jgi:hypothetical protein
VAYTINDVLEIISDCLELGEKVCDAAIATHTDLGGLAAMFLARAGQATYSAGLLAQNGLNGDAMAVARTVTEMSIDFPYIAKDPAVRIPKFSEYEHVSKFRIAKAIEKLHDGNVSQQAMSILQQRHDSARTNNPDSEVNWAGVSIRKRAIEVGRLRTWELPYADMCEASHSCYGTLEYALVGLNSNPSIRWGRMEPDTKAPDLAFAAMTVLMADVIAACKLSSTLDDGIKQLHDKRQSFKE